MRRIRSRIVWCATVFVLFSALPADAQQCPTNPPPPIPWPSMSPGGGTFSTQPQEVTLTGGSSEWRLVYSTDGNEPTLSYSSPLSLTKTTTVKARLGCYLWYGWQWGETVTGVFTIKVATPTVTPPDGDYEPGTPIQISSTTPNTILRYRLDGQTPTDSDPIVPLDGKLMVGAFTLTVRGFSGDMDPSDVASATYGLKWSYNNGAVATGYDFSAALKPDGTVWTWGNNSRRQFGYGERRNGTSGQLVVTQSRVPTNAGVTGVRAIAAAHFAMFALRADGTVWTWGENATTVPVLGRSSCTVPYQSVYYCVRPETIGLTNIAGIAAGAHHGLAVDGDGFVWAWGYNDKGQLGDGTTTTRWQPQIVSGLSNVVEVAAGNSVSYARKNDGTVWAWGNPQLGNGSGGWVATPIKIPVQVGGLPPGITRIWAGYGNGYARAADGTLWVWGAYSSGQLGFGTNQGTPNFMPAAHTSLGAVMSAAGGEQYSTLVVEAGGGRSMGHNWSGQLGDGTTTQRLSPTPVIAVPLLRRIGASWKHTLAIARDHSGWAWGHNDFGQVGNDTTTNVLTPVQIFPVGFFDGCQPAQITPEAPLIPNTGGTQVFDVKVAWDCEWTAASDSTWAHAPAATTTGFGTVTVTFDINPGPQRTGTLTIAGKTITVTQAGGAIVPPTNEEISYIHTDAIGSVRMITDATGTVLARYDYLPFGTEWSSSFSNITNNVKFTGQERDPETAAGGWNSLDYFGARYYGSQLGRFTSPDIPGIDQNPFDPQSWNLYGYVRNNPLRYVDPTGRKCENGYNAETGAFCTETIGEDPYRRANEAWLASQRFFLDSLLPGIANFSAGMGDALTGRMIPGVNTSVTEYVRNQMGTDSVVAKSSLTYRAGDLTGGTVGWTLAGSASATAAAIANGKRGALFGRGTQTVFNSSKVRFGWGWDATVSPPRDVIRLGIGPARGTAWWSHIRFWYP